MKKITYAFFTSLVIQMGFAQEYITPIDPPVLWLKGKVNETILQSKAPVAYHFNFNPVFVPTESKELSYKNILKNKYSLFVVFKSDIDEEVPFLNLKSNGLMTTITNKQLISEKNNTYKKVDSKQGIVLTYLVSQEKKGRNKSSLNLENLSRPNTEKGYRNDILELLYYPHVVNDLEKQKIESYLSIKYGISLLGEVDYINSEGKKIWDYKENKIYNNRVTGIGKDGALHLNQKQSGNAQKDGLYIGVETIRQSNKENIADIPEKSFLIWGDNNGSTKMESDKKVPDIIKKMNRIWKMQSTYENQSMAFATQIMIDKDVFSIAEDNVNSKKDDFVWLVIDRNGSEVFDYHNAEYFMQSADKEGRLFFDNVVWDIDESGSDTFTFIKGPDFFVNYEIADADCNLEPLSEVNLKITGGKGPFRFDFTTPSSTKSFSIEERSFKLSDLLPDNYIINTTDKMLRNQKDTLIINNLKSVSISLASQWYLDNSKETIIIPQIKNPEDQKLSFTWKRGEVLLSTEKQFIATEEGDYKLRVMNEMGCQNELSFRVDKSLQLLDDQWILYPNPAKRDEPFTIRFNLENESEVLVNIFDFSNKLIKSRMLGRIREFEYSETLSTIGTFLIVVTINGKAESAKIIIR